MSEFLLYHRPDGRDASRAQLLVVPSVVCANAVTAEIAVRVGGKSILHQHGCAQIGDDARATTAALQEIAYHPNAWATLVVSLGCETLQGSELAEHLREKRVLCSIVGIQSSGGSAGAIAAGVQAFAEFPPIPMQRITPRNPVRLGVAFVGNTAGLARRYISALAEAGFEVDEPVEVTREPVLKLAEMSSVDFPLGIVLVADRGLPAGPVLVPLLAIAATAELFDAADGEFDLHAPSDESLIVACAEMLGGLSTRAEERGDAHFAVRRTQLTL